MTIRFYVSLVALSTSFAVGVAVLGCSSSDASGVGSAGAAGAMAGSNAGGSSGSAVSSDAVVGGFIVELKAQTENTAPFTNVVGQVSDGPSPANLVWDKTGEAAGCELLEPRAPFCDPGCGGSAVCVEEGQCQNYPATKDLGSVIVKGLGADLKLVGISNIYQAEIEQPYPAAAEGSALQLVVSGGTYGNFEIGTEMIAPLTGTKGALELESGKALALEWAAPAAGDASRLRVKVDISHHGGAKGKIECDVPDTGAFEIPAALVTQLIGLGVAGFPTVSLTRATGAQTSIAPGKVSFEAQSAVSIPLSVVGFVSCSEDVPCPDGKVCQSNLTCPK